MKQAILIGAYKDFDQLRELINVFDETFNIYVHIDKKSNITTKIRHEFTTIKNVRYFSQDYKVNWGGLNLLKAYLKLSEIALEDKENLFFHLISGQDFPVKNIDYFKTFTKKNWNYLRFFKMPANYWYEGGMYRLEYYSFYDLFNAKKSLKWINAIIRFQKLIGLKRPINKYLGQLYGGSMYCSLSRELVQYIIDFTENNPKFFKRFKYTHCPEEIYLHTIIMNSSYSNKVINDSLRFIKWDNNYEGTPEFLDENDFQTIINSNKLFARKIDKNKNDLFQLLINYIKKRQDSSNNKEP